MTAPNQKQVEQITALADAWRVAGERFNQAQAAAEATKVKAEELRRFLEANRTLGDIGVNELTRKTAEFEKLKATADSAGELASNSAGGMQAAYDAMQQYITSIVQTAVAEAPLGGFR